MSIVVVHRLVNRKLNVKFADKNMAALGRVVTEKHTLKINSLLRLGKMDIRVTFIVRNVMNLSKKAKLFLVGISRRGLGTFSC